MYNTNMSRFAYELAAQLEAPQSGRCATCQGRRGIVITDDDYPGLSPHNTPAVLPCADCGWRPLHIRMVRPEGVGG